MCAGACGAAGGASPEGGQHHRKGYNKKVNISYFSVQCRQSVMPFLE